MSTGTHGFLLPWILLAGVLALPAERSVAADSQIYRTVDADGNVIFSDASPAQGSATDSIELSTPNTFSPPAAAGDAVRLEVWLAGDEEAGDTSAAGRYRSLRVAAPPDDAGLRDNAGDITVTGELQPDLLPGHAVQLYLDGVLQQSAAQAQFQLLNVDRGTHTLELRVVDASGNTLISSPPSVFHMQRRSLILQPAKAPRSNP